MKIENRNTINIENVNGISVIDTLNLEEDEVVWYIKDLVKKIGSFEIINILLFGNKEYMISHSKLNSIGFSDMDNIETDCDIYAFIKLDNDEVYITGMRKREMFDMGVN